MCSPFAAPLATRFLPTLQRRAADAARGLFGAHGLRADRYPAATLNLWKEPMELKPDAAIDLCYGVAVWDGEVKPEQVESLYKKWLALRP